MMLIYLNLLFVVLNGYFAIHFLRESPEKNVGWFNLLAMTLNLIPVVGKLSV